MEDKKYKIGDIAQMFGMSVRMLRHYDQIGLLVPQIVDKFTGFRYYGAKEMQKLFLINRLRKIGFELMEIKLFFDNNNFVPDMNSLKEKIGKLEKELEQLQNRCNRLKDFIDYEQKKNLKEDIYFESLPAITVLSYTMKLGSYDELEYHLENVVGPEAFRLGCEIPEPFYCFTKELNKECDSGCIEVEFCDEVKAMKNGSEIVTFKQLPEVPLAICMKVYGPHNQLREKCTEFLVEISKHGYRITDIPRFHYVDFFLNQENTEKWLTIIQVPVEK